MSEERKSCAERWTEELADRMATLRTLWTAYQNNEESDEGSIYDYGLSFDYVAPGTFTDQKEGYWRYQLSWGGPSDEFRFYSSGPQFTPYRITYVFMDWFDGEERALSEERLALLEEIWDWFSEMGSVESEFEKAMED